MMFKLLKKLENDSSGEISFVDVKELYDAAYAEKAKAKVNLKRFKVLIIEAEALDLAYRAQLTDKTAFRYGRAA